ncbi:MAG TPA: two-component system response regulator [Lachnospiraceae bacterium]|jgi:two-component system chemotaxis response regulator CheY|nr:two-component system response regulator [Lachnospiraceae bacterium]HBE07877.1 two-component system response regulator [Lachnospiraceae bacterium]
MGTNNIKILICDDSILARKQLADVIKKFNDKVDIIQGRNGAEAVDLYKSNSPVLVFLDIVMPEKDGIQAVREIMEDDEDANIIIVSSVGTQNQLKAAIEAGARDFIQKPFSEQSIEKILKFYL